MRGYFKKEAKFLLLWRKRMAKAPTSSLRGLRAYSSGVQAKPFIEGVKLVMES